MSAIPAFSSIGVSLALTFSGSMFLVQKPIIDAKHQTVTVCMGMPVRNERVEAFFRKQAGVVFFMCVPSRSLALMVNDHGNRIHCKPISL